MTLTFRVKLLLGYVALVAVAELLTVAALDRSISSELTAQLARRLEAQALGAVEWVSAGRNPDVVATRLAHVVGARVTVLDQSGRLVGDSESIENATVIAPELEEARAGRIGRDRRVDVLYVAVPTPDGLVIRLAAPLSDVNRTLALVRERLLIASAIVFAFAVALSLLVARTLARPLVAMRDAAHRIAQGAYDVVLAPGPRDEFGDLSRSLKTLSEQLARVEAMRRQLIGDVSHEIGTPVAAIQGYAETLLSSDGTADAATTREFLEVIHRNAGRISRLVEDLRFLSAIEHEAVIGHKRAREAVPLLETARLVVGTVRPRIDEKKAKVEIEIGEELDVLGDPDHIERVLLNLVENAVKYGKDGGVVSVRAARKGQRIHVEVIDDGPGIPAEHVARVFDRFYRVDHGRSRDKGGTGLGLAIVKQLAEAMGGAAWLESEVGKGTRFIVDLPAAPDTPT